MRQAYAKVLVRVGMTLLMLAVLLRLVGMSKADLVGDDLAIIGSLATVAVGAAFAAPRRSRKPQSRRNE